MGSLLKAPPLCVIGPAILGEQALTLTGDGAYLVNKIPHVRLELYKSFPSLD